MKFPSSVPAFNEVKTVGETLKHIKLASDAFTQIGREND